MAQRERNVSPTPPRGLSGFFVCRCGVRRARGVSRLQVEPEAGAVAAEFAEAHRHLRRHGARIGPRDDAMHRLARHAQLGRRLHHRKIERGQNISRRISPGCAGGEACLRAMMVLQPDFADCSFADRIVAAFIFCVDVRRAGGADVASDGRAAGAAKCARRGLRRFAGAQLVRLVHDERAPGDAAVKAVVLAALRAVAEIQIVQLARERKAGRAAQHEPV